MVPQHLIHMTTSLENVESILNWGLLFSLNPTEILQSLLGKSFTQLVTEDRSGMICFTELSYSSSREIFYPRRYGIGVSMSWAKSIGARKVDYIDPAEDQRLTAFRNANLEILIDKLPIGMKDPDVEIRWLVELAATRPEFAKSFGLPLDFLEIQHQALWMQTVGHQEEREWRVRSPTAFPNIEVISDSKSRVEMLLRMAKNIPAIQEVVSLRIPPEELLSIYIPKGRVKEVESILVKTGYENCVIKTN